MINNDNYTLLKQEQIPDIQSEGYLLCHKKSGARVCVLSNTDENKVFFVGFRTPPNDSTGVAHIIEHTVLCGSRKFPLKDPFIELVKGSMNTFLNAMTYPDKTLYPVASCNDKDFANLMDVYMDSVFYPNIYQNENIFRQEGWHYELENTEDDLTINGVVYNEMKGAFSSPEGLLEREIFSSLYPDTTYANESGGDPDCIPDLTYEAYLDFHRTYYHPSNSYIYLYGDFDVEERLDWLDRAYLSDFDKISVDSGIRWQDGFAAPCEKSISYPVASNASLERAFYLAAAWSVGTNLDPDQYIAFDLLEYALLNAQGAPLKQALLDAGIGNDIYGGYDSGSLQPEFTVIAKNTDAEKKDQFVSVIRKVLTDLVENGLHKKTLEAALNASEFKFREADYGNIPKGLMFGIQVMDAWLYDDDAPFLHLHELDVYQNLREKLDTGYFEELIRKYLLNNTHCLLLTAVPDPNLNRKKEAALEKKLADYKNTLSEQELEGLIQKTKDVHAFGETPSTPEELATIPHLTREDMKKTAEPFSNILHEDGAVPIVGHEYETNGILYIDLQFAIDHIEEEKLPALGVLRRLLGKLDTKDYSYTDLTDEIYLHTGGIRPEISIYSDVTDHDAYVARFELRIKVLKEKIDEAVKLIKSMLCDMQFTNEKRIHELLAESRSRLRSDLSEAGHSASVKRALSYQSPISRYGDLTSGIAVCTGADSGSAPAADCQHFATRDCNGYILIREIFVIFAGTSSLEAAANSCSAAHCIFIRSSAIRFDVTAADRDVSFITAGSQTDSGAAFFTAFGGDITAADFDLCIWNCSRIPAAVISPACVGIRRSAGSDAGCSVTAFSCDRSAADRNLRVAKITAADTGSAMMDLTFSAAAGGIDRTAGNDDLCVTVHSAADCRADIGTGCCDIAAIDFDIRRVVSRPFFTTVAFVFTATDTATDAGRSICCDCAVIDDNLSAVDMVAAADTGTFAG